jgi:hypothetical protein
MKEQPSVNQLIFLRDAFNFGLKGESEAREFNQMNPMTIFDSIGYIAKHILSKEQMKQLVLAFSSANYGAHLLNSVFPAVENPDEFHSRNDVVFLDEHPIQVLGYEEYEKQIQKGVELGLRRDFILMGFNRQAEARGIDLEWSFHGTINTSGGLQEPGKE